MIGRLLLVAAVAVVAMLSGGCAEWKRIDAMAGTALSPGVCVGEAPGGRPTIRIQSERATVMIDAIGARVVSFRTRTVGAGDTEKLGPESLLDPGWTTPMQPEFEGGALDRSSYWLSDSGNRSISLLSDTVGGLRWRKTFTLHESGLLEIEVTLINETSTAVTRTIESYANGPKPLSAKGELLENTEKTGVLRVSRTAGSHWFTREIHGPRIASWDESSVKFSAVSLAWLEKFSWRESWWLSEGIGGAVPTTMPAADRLPGTKP